MQANKLYILQINKTNNSLLLELSLTALNYFKNP